MSRRTQFPFLEESQHTLTADLERPETHADSNRAMHLNRELIGVADSLERTTAELKQSVAELGLVYIGPHKWNCS